MTQSERKPATKTCTSHCRTCGRHFHGDVAFDLHRLDFECYPPENRRGRKGQPLLAVWTESGVCTFDKPDGSPIVIYNQAGGFAGRHAEA